MIWIDRLDKVLYGQNEAQVADAIDLVGFSISTSSIRRQPISVLSSRYCEQQFSVAIREFDTTICLNDRSIQFHPIRAQ